MAYLHRLALGVLLLVACCWWTQVRAVTPDINQTQQTVCPGLPAGANPLDSMIPSGGTYYEGYQGLATPQTVNAGKCLQVRIDPNHNPGWPPFWASIQFWDVIVTQACPDHSTANPTQQGKCGCDQGYVSAGTSCRQVTAADFADAVARANASGGLTNNSGTCAPSTCFEGIELVHQTCVAYGAGTPGAVAAYFGPFTATGKTCSSSAPVTGAGGDSGATPPENANPPSSAADCKAGYDFGQVNGVNTCVKRAGGTTTGGTTTTTGGVDPGAPTGSTSQTTTVTSTGGQVTTTTTYKDANGNPTGTKVTTTDKPSYCAQKPNDPVCKDSQGTFSGSCGAPPVCTGDAVMCAIAAADFKTSCQFEKTSTDAEEARYAAAKSVTGDQTANLPGNSVVALGANTFDTTERLGAAGALTDLQLTIADKPFTLQLSMLNEWLAKLGYLLVAITGLVCIKILRGQ